MSDLFTPPATTQSAVEKSTQVSEKTGPPPVVITEQEVAFATAAAASLPRTKAHRGVIAALLAMLLSSSAETLSAQGPVPPRRYPPRRDAFLEDAAMAREMRRL